MIYVRRTSVYHEHPLPQDNKWSSSIKVMVVGAVLCALATISLLIGKHFDAPSALIDGSRITGYTGGGLFIAGGAVNVGKEFFKFLHPSSTFRSMRIEMKFDDSTLHLEIR